MGPRYRLFAAGGAVLTVASIFLSANAQDAIEVDLSGYRPGSGARVQRGDGSLRLEWPAGADTKGVIEFDLTGERPLFTQISLEANGGEHVLARHADPVTFLTVGSREGRREAGWVIFFDKVWQRSFETHRATLRLKEARVTCQGNRTTVALDELQAGSFHGELHVTVYRDTRLVYVEAVLSTEEERRAILYDAGLVSDDSCWSSLAWMDPSGEMQREPINPNAQARELAVRHRTLLVRTTGGTLSILPSPHQFFYPLDESHNLNVIWSGNGYRNSTLPFGVGVRQDPEGDKRFVPWSNAPPGTDQRLGAFYLLSAGDSEAALAEVLRFTRGDCFKKLPGFRTFSSHYHFAHTMVAMRRRAEGRDPAFTPDFVNMFKDMGVEIVHLAEFHGDGNPRDPGPKRLPQLAMMHAECARLSDDKLLILPGEEPNVHFGGHWIDFFPKPVNWIMKREPGEPFVEQHPEYGKVYRVRDANELLKLLELEGGLAWTAHPRIKSSFGFPDTHRDRDFYLSDRWLGAAWKAMPADLSRPRLGERVLDLLDDMANWGQPKYVLGEVDVFKIDPTHELYGHMNVNYLQLDRVPRFEDGWHSILDVLRNGKFFVTTGEVLMPDFTVDGVASGDTLKLPGDGRVDLRVALEWTFPLSFLEIVSGDGRSVFRDRIDLSDTGPFGEREVMHQLDLTGRRWVRVAAWDVAVNGAFSQPVWID